MAVTSIDIATRSLLNRFGDYIRNEGDASGWSVRCPIHHPDDEIWSIVGDDGVLQPCALGCEPGVQLAALEARVVRQPGEDDDEPSTPPERNRFVRAHVQLSVEDLTTDPPPLEFILRPYIPAETVSVLSGPGGSNKTTLTSLLVVSRALGRRMLDRMYPREGESVILTTEDRVVHYRRKFAALREHIGPEYNARHVAERVHLLDMSGLPVRLVLAERGEQFKPSPEIDELADALHRVAPRADHIIIETISRVTGGVESNAAMSVLVSACERLAMLAKVAVTLVGHVGQNTARAGIADQYAGRGGSALGDNARSSLVLMPLNPKNVEEYAAGLELSDEDLEHTLVLTQPKRNGTAASESPPRLLRRLSTRFGPVLDDAKYAAIPGATPAPKQRGKRGKPAARTYDQLRAAIVDVITKAQPISGNGVFHTVGGNKTLFTGAVQDLLRDGKIGRDAEGRLIVSKSVPKSVPIQSELGTDGPKPPVPYPLSPTERERGIRNQMVVPDNSEPPNKEPPTEGEVF